MSKQKTYTFYALKSYFAYASQHKFNLILPLVMFSISNSLLAIIPLLIGRLVGALNGQTGDAGLYTTLLILSSIVHDIFWRSAEIVYFKLLLPVSYHYETELFREVINKPYPYFVDKFTGKVSSYITTISQELRGFQETVYYNYSSNIISLLAVIGILTAVNRQTGVIFVSSLLVMVAVGRLSIRNNILYEKLSADANSTKNGKIIDAIANFVNVKSFKNEHKEIARIASEQETAIKAAQKSYVWALVFWGLMAFFVRYVIWSATILYNVYLFNEGRLGIEQLATLLATILLFSSTIWELIWQISQFNLRQARAEEAHVYLFGKRTLVISPHNYRANKKLPQFTKSLEFKDLHFAYPDKRDTVVLHDISLTIYKGEKIGIVGKSGSGKTTLTKLLLGYYPDDHNDIYVDGSPLPASELARLVSYVPQDTSLFHRSIAENIAYAATRDVTLEEIKRAAEHANAHMFIDQIADGYDALVGERGVKLSAGQRQRIAIARAFLDDKPILILDEATSALDSESEVLIQDALESLWQDKTVIAIAHRLSTLRTMDRIIVISEGTVSEYGTHDELIASNGDYAKLWQHQSGGFIKD